MKVIKGKTASHTFGFSIQEDWSRCRLMISFFFWWWYVMIPVGKEKHREELKK